MSAPPRPGLLPRLVALAVVLHGWGPLQLGPSQDELALVQVGPAWTVLQGPQLGINPPLWPLLVNALFPDAWVVAGGRALALLCHALSVTTAARLARRLAPQRRYAPLLAALLVGSSPNLAASGVAFRAYAPLTLLLLRHLEASAALAADPGDPGAARRWRWTAAVLPWLHYLALPWVAATATLGALDPTARRALRRAWWVPLAWAPLVAWIVGRAGERDRFGDLHEIASWVTGLGWFDGPAWRVPIGLATLVVVVSGLRSPRARAVAIGALAAIGVMAAATSLQQVRPPAAALLLAPLLPLLATRPGAPRALSGAIGLLGVALVVGSVRGLPDMLPDVGLQRMVPDAARGWSTLRDAAAGAPIHVPQPQVALLRYTLDGELAAEAAADPACPDRMRCYRHDGVTVLAVDDPPTGLVLTPAPPSPSPFDACAEVVRVGDASLRRCP